MSNSPQPNGAGINGEKSSRTTIFNQGQGQVGIPSELNGHSRTNGEVSKVSHSHDAFREAAMSSTDLTQGPLAPEIEHITQGYQPLAKLITRVTQDTYKELLEVIDKMAEMDPHQPSAPNHFDRNARTNGNGSIESQVNIDKKMLLMNLVQKRRAQFIKLFVLAQWSRQSEEVSRLIDLKIWLDKQMGLHDECIFWMGDLRRSLEPAKVPNPDLETALRVLSTGKVPSVPDVS
jgi:mediator of RNA polymerase II transcription subunit 14